MVDTRRMERRTVDDLLAEARGRIVRDEPAEALAAQACGAVLVDIRSDGERAAEGVVPGSLHVPRTVLEWRLDPASPWRSAHAPGLEDEIVLLCAHGFSSSLAAASLGELGFERVGDVAGGFEAWVDAGLPVVPAPAGSAELPGSGPPAG
jgi:rhodanese-related sulfurtransferase